MDKLIIYTRVSSDEQLKGHSLENQKEKGLSIAKKYNLIPEVYNEGAESSKYETLENRPVLKSLIEKVLIDEIKNVYIFEFSRLSRHDVLSAKLRNIFTTHNVTLYEGEGVRYNLSDPNQEFTMSLLQQVSQLENKIKLNRISENILKGIEFGRIQGKYLPYGYQRDKQRRLAVDDEEAKIVRKIFQLYSAGKGCKQIANYLNSKEIKTRFNKSLTKDITINGNIRKPEQFKWAAGVIHKILRQKRYIGVVEYTIKKNNKDEILEFTCPPIVDPNTFNNAQKMLSCNFNKTNPFKRYDYLLSKKLICGDCGKNYYGRRRASGKDNYYICLSKRYQEPCNNKSFNITFLEDCTWRCLMDSQILYDQVKSEHNSSNQENLIDLNKQVINTEKEIKKQETAIENLAEAFAEGDINKKSFKTLVQKKNNQVNFLKREYQLILKELEIASNKKTSFSYMTTFAGKYLFSKDFSTRKTFVDKFVDKVIIHNVENLDKPIDDLFHNRHDKGISMFRKLNKQDTIIYVEIMLTVGVHIFFVATNRSKRFYSCPPFINFNKETSTLEYNKQYSSQ